MCMNFCVEEKVIIAFNSLSPVILSRFCRSRPLPFYRVRVKPFKRQSDISRKMLPVEVPRGPRSQRLNDLYFLSHRLREFSNQFDQMDQKRQELVVKYFIQPFLTKNSSGMEDSNQSKSSKLFLNFIQSLTLTHWSPPSRLWLCVQL